MNLSKHYCIYVYGHVFGFFIFSITAERRKKLRGGQSPLQDETSIEGTEGEEGEDYMDEGMRVVDADALARINQIIAEHAADLEMAQTAPGSVFILLVAIYLIKLGNYIIYFIYIIYGNQYFICYRRTSNKNGCKIFKLG